MTRPNLLPWRQRRRRQRLRRFLGALTTSALGAAFAIALLGHHMAAGVEPQRQANHQLTATIATLDADLAEIDQLRGEQEELERQVTTLRRLWAERFATSRTLGALADAVVPGAHYTRLARTDGAVAIHGVADTHDRVSELMHNLQRTPRFQSPVLKTITGVDHGESGRGARAATFELSFHESNP